MADLTDRRYIRTVRYLLFLIFLVGFLTACGVSEPMELPSSPEATKEPFPTQVPMLTVTPLRPGGPGGESGESVLPTSDLPDSMDPPPAVQEQRLLSVEWPPRIRAGDSDLVILTLEIDEGGNLTATAEYEGNEIVGKTVQIPNLYDTHNVLAQARLDMVGLEYSPRGEVLEPMRPGVPVKFVWSVLPQKVGSYRGTIWVHLQFIPLEGGETTRSVLSAQVIDIDAVNLVGLGGTPARVIGSVGAVIGAFLSLDKLGGALWRTIKSLVTKPKKSPQQE